MSIRPKRRAAYQQNYNEDEMYIEQVGFNNLIFKSYIDQSQVKPPQMSAPQFVEPRSRIPQHRVQPPTASHGEMKFQVKRFSLKTFLTTKIPSNKVKTRLCGSKRASMADAKSYNKILSSKRRIIQNKRKRKEELKNVGFQLEREKHFSTVISPDFSVPNSSRSLLDSSSIPMNYHAQVVADSEKVSSKVARDPVNIITSKRAREENAKVLEESEQKSTVISCYEGAQNKSSPDNEFAMDPELMGRMSPRQPSPEAIEMKNDSEDSGNQNDDCLIDRLFEENERECEEMIGESLPDY